MENIAHSVQISRKLNPFYPWFVVTLASLMLFYKYLLQVFPSVITNQLMRDFHLSGAGLGNLAACFFYSYLIMQFFSGYLVDRFNVKLMLTSAIFISACGALLFAASNAFSLAITGRILMGVGAAFATVGYMKIAAIYFPVHRFTLVSGLLTIGVMLGAVFGEAPLAMLIKSLGWHAALVIVALIGIGVCLLFTIFIKNNMPTQHTITTQPIPKINISDILRIIKNKTNWYLTLYSGLAFAPLAVFGGLWGTPFIAKAYHTSQANAALYVSMVYIGFGVGGPLLGSLAHYFQERFKLMILGLLLSFICLTIIIFDMPSVSWLMLYTFLFGIGTSAFMLGFAVGKEINPIYVAATIIAFINSGDAICGALSEPFIGKLLDLNNPAHTLPTHFAIGTYQLAFITLFVELILAYVFLNRVQAAITTPQPQKTRTRSLI